MNSSKEPNPDHWQHHYILLEVKRFEVTLKHFFESGNIAQEDFHFLMANLKMIKTFLNTRFQLERKQTERKNYWGNLYLIQKNNNHKNRKIINSYNQLSLFDYNRPLPITGEIKVTGLTEGLSQLKPKDQKPLGPKFPYKIPAGTQWNQVIIKFLDDERVDIYVKKQKHTTDFKEMGFVGKGKIPEPSEQWTFLKILAQCNGEITIKDESSKDTYKQQKHLLTESLQNYFSIDYDPFYPYKSSPEKQGNSYRIKLTLLPPPNRKREKIIEDMEEDVLGIKEYLDEQAPSVIEP